MKISMTILFVLALAFSAFWIYSYLNPKVEVWDEIVGLELSEAYATYLERPPDNEGFVNVYTGDLFKIDRHLTASKEDLLDSMVQIYLWNEPKYTMRIWVGKTKRSDSEIINAIRYSNIIQF